MCVWKRPLLQEGQFVCVCMEETTIAGRTVCVCVYGRDHYCRKDSLCVCVCMEETTIAGRTVCVCVCVLRSEPSRCGHGRTVYRLGSDHQDFSMLGQW